ncbi:hypothetical protein [Streptomyces sp. NPDC006739]|uniref:hypothetical protein n=1 Tax=Streptomyces sp. NPDC006739 TaxID=3364763 RepID=UPI0036CD0C89
MLSGFVLAAVHAARPGAIRLLQLRDLDIDDRRLVIDGRVGPLDELTLQSALAWLDYWRRRWLDTANLRGLRRALLAQTAELQTPPSGKQLGPA